MSKVKKTAGASAIVFFFGAVARLFRSERTAESQDLMTPDRLDDSATPERVGAAVQRRGAVVFLATHPEDFGFDPEILAAREKEVEAGHFVPASEFFHGLRSRVRSGC